MSSYLIVGNLIVAVVYWGFIEDITFYFPAFFNHGIDITLIYLKVIIFNFSEPLFGVVWNMIFMFTWVLVTYIAYASSLHVDFIYEGFYDWNYPKETWINILLVGTVVIVLSILLQLSLWSIRLWKKHIIKKYIEANEQ